MLGYDENGFFRWLPDDQSLDLTETSGLDPSVAAALLEQPGFVEPAYENMPHMSTGRAALASLLSSIPSWQPGGMNPHPASAALGVIAPILGRLGASLLERGTYQEQEKVASRNAQAKAMADWVNKAALATQAARSASEANMMPSPVSVPGTPIQAGKTSVPRTSVGSLVTAATKDTQATREPVVTQEILEQANDQKIKAPATWLGTPISAHPELADVFPKPKPSTVLGGFGQEMDPGATADALYEGRFSPEDVNPRSNFGGAVLSILAKRYPNFDWRRKRLDWIAIKQLTSSQNQGRVLALRQSLKTLPMHLKRLLDLNTALDAAGVARGSVYEANKVSLEAAARGIYGKAAAAAAAQFIAQESLMENDFATVFSNGFAPQEDSYKLARRMMRVDLPSNQVLGNAENIRADALFKKNALEGLSPIRSPETEDETPPETKEGQGAPGEGPKIPAGRVHVVGPNGEDGHVVVGTKLPKGWKVVQ